MALTGWRTPSGRICYPLSQESLHEGSGYKGSYDDDYKECHDVGKRRLRTPLWNWNRDCVMRGDRTETLSIPCTNTILKRGTETLTEELWMGMGWLSEYIADSFRACGTEAESDKSDAKTLKSIAPPSVHTVLTRHVIAHSAIKLPLVMIGFVSCLADSVSAAPKEACQLVIEQGLGSCTQGSPVARACS